MYSFDKVFLDKIFIACCVMQDHLQYTRLPICQNVNFMSFFQHDFIKLQPWGSTMFQWCHHLPIILPMTALLWNVIQWKIEIPKWNPMIYECKWLYLQCLMILLAWYQISNILYLKQMLGEKANHIFFKLWSGNYILFLSYFK